MHRSAGGLLAIFVGFVALAFGLPLAVAALVSKSRDRVERPSGRRRIVGVSALVGGLSITPLTFFLALGAYAGLLLFLVGWAIGSAYGVLVATLLIRARGAPLASRPHG